MKRYILIILLLKLAIICHSQSKPLDWVNPITSGLPGYGMKDFFLYNDEGNFYILGTEYKNPIVPSRGINLYQSGNLSHWEKSGSLLNIKKLSNKTWCYDIFNAPEIHKYRNKYYLTFNGGNSVLRPYKKTGFGLAVSDHITGPYTLLNPKSPLFESNQATMVVDADQQPYVIYEMDGRFYSVPIDLAKGIITSLPKEFLGPSHLGSDYKYLDAPQFHVKDGKYHLIFSQFFAGYAIKVNHYVADSLLGTYRKVESDPIYSWLESEADENVKMVYKSKNGFAPPTQVVFSNQITELQDHQYAMVYHSSEKYSEPYLCIETFNWRNDTIEMTHVKSPYQGLHQQVSATFINSQGYDSCVQLKNKHTRVVIEPNFGGRVLTYELNGKNILFTDTTKNGWTYIKDGFTEPPAGRFDIGPEATMPKRNFAWLGAWKPEILSDHIVRITSAKDSILGIQIIREFKLDPVTSHLRCTQTVVNHSSKEFRANHWGRTFAIGGGIALIPKNPNSRFPKGYCIYRPPLNAIDFKPAAEPNIRVREGIIEIINTPSDPKFVMDNDEGWLGYMAPNDLLFVKKYAVYPERKYLEVTAATSSIWYNKEKMVEIEPIGPEEILTPGSSFTFTEDWFMREYKFPKDRLPDLSVIKQIIKSFK